MTYFLYARPDGYPDITEYKINPAIFPGYVFLGEHDTRPDLTNKRYENGEWVPIVPEYLRRREKMYPTVREQLDALWHAMDDGTLPMVPAFYDPIKKVKDLFPKLRK